MRKDEEIQPYMPFLWSEVHSKGIIERQNIIQNTDVHKKGEEVQSKGMDDNTILLLVPIRRIGEWMKDEEIIEFDLEKKELIINFKNKEQYEKFKRGEFIKL